MSTGSPAIRGKETGLSARMGDGLSRRLALQPAPVWLAHGTTAPWVGLGGGCTARGVPYHPSRAPLGVLRESGVSQAQAEPPMVVPARIATRSAQMSGKKKSTSR